MKRYALVSLRGTTQDAIEAYIYSNYAPVKAPADSVVYLTDEMIDTVGPHNMLAGGYVLIEGRDVAGFTLDAIRDRLASGLHASAEIDLSHPIMKELAG